MFLGSCGSESAETVQDNKYEVLIESSCGFDKDVINKKVYAFASDIDADNALEKIMKLTGLPPNFEIKAANVDNACAVVECDDKGGCKRLIYYNQEFIEKMNDATNTDFTELAILAHEIGHHLSGHTIAEPKNRHEEELEADKFAGFILHQLGASIETAKNVFSYSPEEGSQTHPPKAARIAAITNGWYDSKRRGNSVSEEKTNKSINSFKFYGDEISNVNISSILNYKNNKKEALKGKKRQSQIFGSIVESCCFNNEENKYYLELATDYDTVFVKFLNMGFSVPDKRYIKKKRALIQGSFVIDTISIEYQKHIANDAKKSQEEINKILKPKYKISFLADGIVIFESEKIKLNKLSEIFNNKEIITFNEDNAYNFIKNQVDFGPRVPNTNNHRKCGDWLVETLTKFKLKVTEQIGEVVAFNGEKMPVRNIIAKINPNSNNKVLLCAHWDTRPFADRDSININQPVIGANDGASGVGVLLEIARVLSLYNIEIGVEIVLFDMNDYGPPNFKLDVNQKDSWCLGSQYWSKNFDVNYKKPSFGILLNMVGAKNAVFPKEEISRQYASKQTEDIWTMANSLGFEKYFKNYSVPPISDDHLYLVQLAQIPTLNIIHFDKRPNSGNFDFGIFHHTHQDNLNIIHKPTLKAVGQTVLAYLQNVKLE